MLPWLLWLLFCSPVEELSVTAPDDVAADTATPDQGANTTGAIAYQTGAP